MHQFQTAIREVLQSLGNIGLIPASVKEFVTNSGNAFSVFRIKQPYIDMRSGEQEIKTAFGMDFWTKVVFGIPSLIISVLTCIFVVPSILGIVLAILGTAVEWAITLVITAAFVMLVTYYSGAWSGIVAKILAVLVIIGAVSGAIGVIGSVIGIIVNFVGITLNFTGGLLGIIENAFAIIGGIVNVAVNVMALNGLNKGIGYNG